MNSATVRLSFIVYLMLLALLALTVWVSKLDTGSANVAIAIGIAGAKGLLVLFFFMNLRKMPAIRIAVAAVVIFLLIVMMLTASDFYNRLGTA